MLEGFTQGDTLSEPSKCLALFHKALTSQSQRMRSVWVPSREYASTFYCVDIASPWKQCRWIDRELASRPDAVFTRLFLILQWLSLSIVSLFNFGSISFYQSGGSDSCFEVLAIFPRLVLHAVLIQVVLTLILCLSFYFCLLKLRSLFSILLF